MITAREFHGVFFALDLEAHSPLGIPIMYTNASSKVCVFYDARSIEELRPDELRHAHVIPGVHTGISAYLTGQTEWTFDIRVYDEIGAYFGDVLMAYDDHDVYSVFVNEPRTSVGSTFFCTAGEVVDVLRKQLAILISPERVTETSRRYLVEGEQFSAP